MNDIVLPRVAIHVGDCLESLRAMEAESVHCCVTSPPYWGLRDYGHDGQIGLEQTPAEYVAKMVEVFREVRRVLRDDGTCWINLGSSYNGSGGIGGDGKQQSNRGCVDRPDNRAGCDQFKPKDLVPIPWMVAMALQADGWWLRQDIIWAKPNPMPESVTDRCTKAHEYIFLLAKSERYHFDADAICEPSVDPIGSAKRYAKPFFVGAKHDAGGYSAGGQRHTGGVKSFDGTRNRRSVWTVATQPYPEAHFATYPPKLIEPCILAGCPADGTVLDPFGGSGTTAAVAVKHGRSAVLCELNPAYAQLAERRVREQLDGVGLFVGE